MPFYRHKKEFGLQSHWKPNSVLLAIGKTQILKSGKDASTRQKKTLCASYPTPHETLQPLFSIPMLINQIRQLLILRIIHQPPQRLTNVLRSSRSKQASSTASKKSVKCRFDCFINPVRNSVTLALTASVSFAVSVVIGHTRNSHNRRIKRNHPPKLSLKPPPSPSGSPRYIKIPSSLSSSSR